MGTAFRATVVVFGVWLAFAAPGCGNSSTPKNPPAQTAVAANAEEQAEAPAEKAPAKVEKKPEVKPAPAPWLDGALRIRRSGNWPTCNRG